MGNIFIVLMCHELNCTKYIPCIVVAHLSSQQPSEGNTVVTSISQKKLRQVKLVQGQTRDLV